MQIKVSTIIRYYITFLIVMNVSLTKVAYQYLGWFASTYHIIMLSGFSAVVLYLYCIMSRNVQKRLQPYSRYLNCICTLTTVVIMIEIIATWSRYGISIRNFSYTFYVYMFIYLVYPLTYLLVIKDINFSKMVKAIIVCTVLSLLLRWAIATVYNSTGTVLIPSIPTECASAGWTRNGNMRINPPCFIALLVPLCMYYYYCSNKIINRIYSIIGIAIAILYTLYVHQARSFLIYLSASILIGYLMKKREVSRKLAAIIAGIFIVVIVLNTQYANSLFASFSSESELASSTITRLVSLEYYLSIFINHPLTGLGALWKGFDGTLSIIQGPFGYACLEDLGLLGGIFRFGFLGGLLYFSIIIRMINRIKFSLKMRSVLQEDWFMLLFCCFCSYLLFGINIDWFYQLIAFSLPFVIVIFEYPEIKLNEVKCSVQ